MKKLLTLICLLGLSMPLTANCGNDNGNGQGCSGDNGGGSAGPQGPAGLNGANGQNEKDGKDTSYQFRGTDLTADVAVRLISERYVDVEAYDTYVFGSQPSQDVFGNGHNMMIGARIVLKPWKGHVERKLDEQAKQIKDLQAVVSRLKR